MKFEKLHRLVPFKMTIDSWALMDILVNFNIINLKSTNPKIEQNSFETTSWWKLINEFPKKTYNVYRKCTS